VYGEVAGLPGIEEVSDKDGNGDAGEDLAGYEVDGETADGGEADDEEQVGESGKEETEEAVYVARGEERGTVMGGGWAGWGWGVGRGHLGYSVP